MDLAIPADYLKGKETKEAVYHEHDCNTNYSWSSRNNSQKPWGTEDQSKNLDPPNHSSVEII